VSVLPAEDGDLDDRVYYTVKRTINGSTVRYVERWAQEIDCRGGAINKEADSCVTYTGAVTTTITGLDHLEGEEVVVWANGFDVGTDDDGSLIYTVASGQITLASAATNVVIGLPYTARFQSAKRGVGEDKLFSHKKAGHLGLLLADFHPRGLRFGPDFDNLDDMPLIEEGTNIGSAVVDEYHQDPIEFPGTWGFDSRLCLEAKAPRPCTVLAAVLEMTVA
jgi:hypothetical protein